MGTKINTAKIDSVEAQLYLISKHYLITSSFLDSRFDVSETISQSTGNVNYVNKKLNH